MKLYDRSDPAAATRAPRELEALSFAVVGLGRFGSIHARKLSNLPEFRLEAVVDCDPQTREAARALGLPAFASVSDLPARIQAATVATNAATHADVAIDLMRRGCHVLVEKPLATSLADSRSSPRPRGMTRSCTCEARWLRVRRQAAQ